ncbi:MAG: glycoside hydrolase family 38 N-terminal domain-containing protein, partial [Anaerolineaceae bacterium]
MTIDTIYMIHHTHTDIGFTNDQPIFWEMQYRFIDDALRLIDLYKNNPPDSQFRWTVETTCGLDAWLKTATNTEIDRLIAAEKAGLLEVMAMQTNNTPLLNTIQLIESLRPVERMRKEFGFDIRHAMNCDINGQNWTLPDVLLDAGIEAFSMAINHHFGGPPTPRPNVFLWQTPGGRTMPVNNGWQYSKLNEFGLASEVDDQFTEWLPKINTYLDSIGYPLPYLMMQGFHPYGDNASAWAAFAEFADRWNKAGKTPRLVSATPRMFWDRLKKDGSKLPTIDGDWTDYWNFGCISAARETSINRTSRSRLYRSDALSSMVNLIGADKQNNFENSPARWSDRTHELYRDHAWLMLNLYGEHTWGADTASNEPQLEDSLSMDNHKKNMAYTARSLSLLLERDALADFSRFIPHNDPTELMVFNPLPWERTISGPLAKNMLIPRGLGSDSSSSRHFLGRMAQPTDFWTGRSEREFNGGLGWLLKPVKIPAFGYAVVSWDELTCMAEAA